MTIQRYSSRLNPDLGRTFLAEQLRDARSYRRIAGYFTSSLFEVAGEWLAGALVSSGRASPGEGGLDEYPWYVQEGGYVHYEDSDNYEGPPVVLGIAYHRSSDWLFGLTLFNNSFGQFSQYAYAGGEFYPVESVPGLRLKLTAGIVQGYHGEHFDALPIRWEERWGLGVVPSIGYQRGRLGVDVAFLKESAVLFLLGYRL